MIEVKQKKQRKRLLVVVIIEHSIDIFQEITNKK